MVVWFRRCWEYGGSDGGGVLCSPLPCRGLPAWPALVARSLVSIGLDLAGGLLRDSHTLTLALAERAQKVRGGALSCASFAVPRLVAEGERGQAADGDAQTLSPAKAKRARLPLAGWAGLAGVGRLEG